MTVAKALAAMVAQEPRAWVRDVALHAHASPCVQALLFALEGDRDLVFLLIPSLLGSSVLKVEGGGGDDDEEKKKEKGEGVPSVPTVPRVVGLKEAGSLFADVAPRHIRSVMDETAGSHLLEAVLAVAPDEVHAELVSRFVVGHTVSMARHPTANYVLQAAISTLRDPHGK